MYYAHPAATGLIAVLLEVSGDSSNLKTEPARLCQGCLQGNGVLGDTEFGTQVSYMHDGSEAMHA